MQFISDSELSLFIWRHFSPAFEDRSLVLRKNQDQAERVEKIIGQSSSWRFNELCIVDCILSLSEEEIGTIRTSLAEVEFKVGGERENCWLDEVLGLKISVIEQKHCADDLMEPVDMLICMLSACCTQSDVLSASRFFATLKPIVLPALRRLSAVRGLNMLQTLFSYTMEATIEDNAGTDSVLAENIEFLKMFDQAVDRMHEELISVADIRMALNTAVQTAANFLLSTPKYPCNSKVRSGQKFVQQQIGQLVENFNLMNRLAPNSQQKGPSFVTSREKISRLLIDRIAFMDITPTSLQVMSPVFKSPKVQTIIAKSGTDVDLCNSPPLKTEGSNEVVPARKLASFLNNNTPTPTRPNVRSCMFNSGDSGFEDVLEENCSDVILPVESSPLKPLKNITPHRPKTKGLRVLKNQEVRKRPATKADIAPTKRSKVSQPSSQKSITSFFIRK